MKFVPRFKTISIDKSRFNNQLREFLEDAIVESAREWLISTQLTIPVWSGASRGTFLELASRVNFALPISPRSRGRGLGVGAGRAASRGDLDVSRTKATFTYETTLAHLIFNEQFNANQGGDPNVFSRLIRPGPYRFRERGQASFRSFTQNLRIPRPFFRTKRI